MHKKQVGAALVVGGGIGGMQAALDLTASGIKVYLVDTKSSIGGVMSQLDKTFPTNECAMCTMAPRLVELSRNKDVEIITLSDVDRIDGEPGNFRVTLKKRARYIDEGKCTGCGECEDICPIRLPDEHNMHLIKTKAINRLYPQAIPNTYVIEKLGQSPCRFACPAGQKAQGYIALIKEKRYEDAYHVILRDNPFPSVCGRVCMRYCEEECTRGRVDEPVSIMNLKRYVADWAYERKISNRSSLGEERNNKKDPKRVAVVGSGPAGLTAARDLSDLGYSVTVFETLSEPGGMIRFGVPEYRLPKARLEWDIKNILSNRIELRTNHKIESIDSLLHGGFHAVFIATGFHEAKKLPIPGSDLPDVETCTDFLRAVAMGEELKLKKRILILGGGNVAIDVARTAIRLGAEEVRLACLEPREKVPADLREIEDAENEGVMFFPSRSFLEICSQNGNVSGVRCGRVNFHGFDEDGKPLMDVIKGSEHTIEADMVIFAVGLAPEIPFIHEGIALTKFGTIKVDENTLATSKQGVFAGGDVVHGINFQYIIEAIASGHRAAQSIDLYLKGEDLKPIEPLMSKVELSDEEIQKKIKSKDKRHLPPVLPVEDRKRNFVECQQGLTEEEAIKEANRCLECGICSECLLCMEKCEAEAINHEMPREEIRELEVGAVILSPGYDVFDAGKKEELGYGRYPNVLNALEFERILSPSGPFSGEVLRPYDKKTPERIAFIQCVGSRDFERDYCSSVCCMYATKEAIIAKEHVKGDLECDIFFMDMRAFGKGFDEYYQRAKKLGVNYIRCRPPSVEEMPQTRNLKVTYLTEGDQKVSRVYDMVVLSVGMQPPKSAQKIAEKFGIELNEASFCNTSVFEPVETTREGIYASGPFTEPKDIPETVMQASSAASRVLSLLKDVKGSLIKPKEFPPEKNVRGKEPKIGVFVCHCGTNIASVVNVPEVVEYVNTLPDVVYAENNLYTCSQDTQEKIKKVILDHDLNRVVVASCTPRTHEPLFRDTIQEGGLNPYLFEMANIRDQCSWVHIHEPERATEKAKDLLRMAVAKARLLEPLKRRLVEVNKSALVIGGGLSGMTSSLELASLGFDVYLVEKENELGGHLRHIYYLLNGENPQDRLRHLVERIQEADQIHLLTETNIKSMEGSIGNFKTVVTNNGDSREIEHGVVVVATGAKEYKPEEYLYGQNKGVMTQLEFEDCLKRGTWYSPSDYQPLKTVVMIQCVGSRDEERPYCSRVCCAEAIKNAIKIKELSSETDVCILYRDVRVYGFRESYYTKARELGVVFIRYEEDFKPEVIRTGKKLLVKVFDQILRVPLEISADLLILSAGIIPNDENEAVAQLLKVPLNNEKFFLEAHMKLRPVEFAKDGVYVCGLAHSAKAIEEGIIQAQAAASRAATVLSKDCIELEANISEVVDEKCDGCAYCIDPCPYNALTLIEYMRDGKIKKTVETNEVACKGCGCCQATCPKEGIFVRGFTLKQFAVQINAALGIE